MSKEKILHCFLWETRAIIENLYKIKEANWNSILVTPVQPSKEEENGLWYMRYQIINLSIGNRYGSKADLEELCQKAHELGIKIYVDIIVTHFGNKGGGNEALIPHNKIDKEIVNNPYFWREKKHINYNDRYSIVHHCNGLPSIRTENHDYQNLVIKFLDELIACGIDGVRLDSAKMIATPEEFGENNQFFTRVLKKLKKPLYIFGEVIFEKKEIINKYEKYIDVLTQFNEDAYNLNKEKTIFFVESHDFYLDREIGCTRNWSTDMVITQYEYLAKDFQKVLFYVRPMDNACFSDRLKQINLKYK